MFKLNKLLILGLVSLSVTLGAGLHASGKWTHPRYMQSCSMKRLVNQGLEAVQAVFEGDVPQEDLAARLDNEGHNFLHVAAGVGNVPVLEYLLDVVGMDIDSLNGRSETPLFIAAEVGNTAAVRFLLERDAAVNMQTTTFTQPSGHPHGRVPARLTHGETPLHAAARGCHPETVALLLQYEAEVNAVDSRGNTPLVLLYRMSLPGYEERSVETARLLLESGADANHIDYDQTTLLHRAVSAKRYEMARLLVAYGARADIAEGKGNTASDEALQSGDQKMVDILRGVEGESTGSTHSWLSEASITQGFVGLALYLSLLYGTDMSGVSML